MELLKKIPLVAVGCALCFATALGCSGDLGDPVLRYADWDAQAPGDGGATNSNNVLTEWLPECGSGYYPCPPYGTRRGDTVENLLMLAANDAADLMADEDGILSLADLHQSGKKLLFIFMTAGW